MVASESTCVDPHEASQDQGITAAGMPYGSAQMTTASTAFPATALLEKGLLPQVLSAELLPARRLSVAVMHLQSQPRFLFGDAQTGVTPLCTYSLGTGTVPVALVPGLELLGTAPLARHSLRCTGSCSSDGSPYFNTIHISQTQTEGDYAGNALVRQGRHACHMRRHLRQLQDHSGLACQ